MRMKTQLSRLSLLFFIWLLLPVLVHSQNNSGKPTNPPFTDTFSKPINRGEVRNPAINEASGIVASRNNPDVLWTHNDSGNDPTIYAISTSGETLGEWVVAGATNRDWEDIAIGPGPEEGINYLYVGDIGDNQAVRAGLDIYRFPEPTIGSDSNPVIDTVREVEKIRVKYPDGARDAETLLVDPLTRDLYILSKRDRFARLYYLPYPQSTLSTILAQKVGEWSREIRGIFNQPVGGDISPDGRELLVKSYVEVMYWQREDNQTSVFEMMQRKPKILPYTVEPQGEAVGWSANGSGYFTLSEKQGSSVPTLYFYKRNRE